MPDIRKIQLHSGLLTVNVTRADWALDDLCAFAARDNPRRAFLVVSKVLGRHMPTRPSAMRASFRDLAAMLPEDLPGPVLVIGMAETAICLGQGVHEELLRRSGRDDILYLHSTRQLLDHPELCRFEEPHSHASSHIVYRPDALDGAFAHPRSLIIVDDEISTGTTIANLAKAMVAALPSIERLVAVTLTDWSLGRDWPARLSPECETFSLLSGKLSMTTVADAPVETKAFNKAAPALGTMHQHHNFGRLGRADVADEGDRLAETQAFAPQSRIRVLGTGEFTYPSFRIAERLEQMGHDVVMQSTTRSPVQMSDVIRHKMSFADNYATAVPNFLYNVDPAEPRATLICHETPDGSVDPQCARSPSSIWTTRFSRPCANVRPIRLSKP
jgi:Phosphoribosyl transferase/TRSP domain C terminus to PRTase_2